MSGESIRPGWAVRLRSGGPAMTVVKKVPACWECTWFDGAELRSATFVEPDLVAEAGPAAGERHCLGADLSGLTLVVDSPRAAT